MSEASTHAVSLGHLDPLEPTSIIQWNTTELILVRQSGNMDLTLDRLQSSHSVFHDSVSANAQQLLFKWRLLFGGEHWSLSKP